MQCQKCWPKNALGIGTSSGQWPNYKHVSSHGGRNKRIHSEKGSISVINE